MIKHNQAFTLIELLAVIVILAIILIIAVPQIFNTIENSKESAYNNQLGIIKDATRLYRALYENEISNSNDITVSLKTLYEKDILKEPVINPMTNAAFNENFGIRIITDENGVETYEIIEEVSLPDYVDSKGVNRPRLSPGMIPIKWDGTTEIETTESDSDWYDYTNKKWANAKTEDGSYWVWIPRYAYQIATCYHTNGINCETLTGNEAGTINIKFLINDTNDTSDNTPISEIATYNGSSQTNYIVHPAFTFGNTDLTGIWVSKFQMGGTADSLNSKPNIQPNVYLTLNDTFTATRNMEVNNNYGWDVASGLNSDSTFTIDTNDIDTHMMKNIEWGMVVYLTQSVYGINAETTSNESLYNGGGENNEYKTHTEYSTTGNIFGIYDFDSAWGEIVAAYINNNNPSLSNNALSLLNADGKYKDVYEVGSPDNYNTNYALLENRKGDAMYEISSRAGYLDYSEVSNGWYVSEIQMMQTSNPCIMRGYGVVENTFMDIYTFSNADGRENLIYAQYDVYFYTWRGVILVKEGL